MIRISQPQIGDADKSAVMAVLDSGQLAAGPVTRKLEEVFAREVSQTAEAVAVANGTAALHIALLACDIGAGDEVITTPFTFQATANMILAAGARPVFVDVLEDGNINPAAIEAAITPRTRALLPVHLYGRLCDMQAIEAIARKHGLHLIEDAAQAHLAEGSNRRAGSFGIGCFSFYATKNLMSGEGGMLSTGDAALAERMRRIRHHGQSEQYKNVELGFNYRTTDIAAAIALTQLDLLAQRTEMRRSNAAFLSAHLRGLELPPEPPEAGSMVWHQYTIRLEDGREELRAWLRERGIESAVYYPQILPDQPLYQQQGFDGGAYPVARRLASQVLSLPVHPALTQSDLEQICQAVNSWVDSKQKKLTPASSS